LRDIVEPFISTTLGIEPIIDAIPSKLRRKRWAYKIGKQSIFRQQMMSDTVMKKSIAHVLKAAIPGLVVSFDKYGNIVYDYYKNREETRKRIGYIFIFDKW
jgi:hypothetical protein